MSSRTAEIDSIVGYPNGYRVGYDAQAMDNQVAPPASAGTTDPAVHAVRARPSPRARTGFTLSRISP
jgi:hypothetical protein